VQCPDDGREPKEASVRVADVVAEILKREGVELIIGYPVNDVLEAAARADIRTVIVRQERVGIHMADAMSRVTSSQRIGVFAMQHGPGTENAFGAVAQAYADSVPVLILPEGYPRRSRTSHPTSAPSSITAKSPNGSSKSCFPARYPMHCDVRGPNSRTVVPGQS
jgi:glyoxylate carboligase